MMPPLDPMTAAVLIDASICSAIAVACAITRSWVPLFFLLFLIIPHGAV